MLITGRCDACPKPAYLQASAYSTEGNRRSIVVVEGLGKAPAGFIVSIWVQNAQPGVVVEVAAGFMACYWGQEAWPEAAAVADSFEVAGRFIPTGSNRLPVLSD